MLEKHVSKHKALLNQIKGLWFVNWGLGFPARKGILRKCSKYKVTLWIPKNRSVLQFHVYLVEIKKKKQRGQFVFLSITNDLYIDFIQQLQCKNCVNFNRG